MCDPVMLAAASAVTTTLGSFQASAAAAEQARFQQQVALDNAARTEEQMADAKVRGADEEQMVARDGSAVVANTRAALASNNMDITFGSPLDAILQTSMEVERDRYRVRRNTDEEVRDLEVQRTNYLNNASASAATARNRSSAGFVAGVGTALSGASGVIKARAVIE